MADETFLELPTDTEAEIELEEKTQRESNSTSSHSMKGVADLPEGAEEYADEKEDLPLLRLRIEGRVQGVGFRANAEETARKIGDLQGFVRNLSDSSVEIWVRGPKEKLEEFLRWSRRGPAMAMVNRVLEDWESDDEEFSRSAGKRLQTGFFVLFST